MNCFILKNSIKRLFFATIIFLLCVIIFSLSFLFVEKTIFYPLKYKDEVLIFSAEYDLPPALVFATIKVESGFNSNAISSIGAKGLMQITDNTGAYIAKKLKIIEYDLFDAKTNINFGCYYLKYLLNRFEVADTAICAYNAGEGNVDLWLKNSDYSTDGKMLKKIPFSETERYLKKIKKSFIKYTKLYKICLTNT